MEIGLQDILCAREARVREQQRLLSQYKTPVVCFTMNIPGPVKTSPLICRGFYTGLELLDRQIPPDRVLYRNATVLPTGCEGLYAVSMSPEELKALCTAIEDRHPLGRLFDMDVLNPAGIKLERGSIRSCMVCGAPGRGCAAGRLHSVAQLQHTTSRILTTYFASADRAWMAAEAVQSLLCEVYTTPKPGLVDRRNSGSHRDMDLDCFIASAKALEPYFSQCVKIGQDTAHRPPEETFPLLRQAGLEAERTMYQVTGGVNTHKGAIYTLGVICGSLGRLWSCESPIAKTSAILAECAGIVRASVTEDFAAADGSTTGQMLYLQHGIGGVRGEVAAGLPSVAKIGLPYFQQAVADGVCQNDAGVYTLLHFIANITDTNLYRRGGKEGAQWASEIARTLLSPSPYPPIAQIEALDDAFIARNLSPGGCADLLAVTYFLHRLSCAEQKPDTDAGNY